MEKNIPYLGKLLLNCNFGETKEVNIFLQNNFFFFFLTSCVRGRLMEVNENILHKPSILQEKVKRAGEVGAHPALLILFLYHSTLNIVSFLAIY